MKRIWLNIGRLSLIAGLLSGCANLSLPSLTAAPNLDAISRLAKLTRKSVKVAFYSRLSNNEIVPLVPDSLESLRYNGQFSLDAGAFPRQKGLEQTFPFIEPGEHLIELTFKEQKKPVEIPIVVPDSLAEEMVILVILAFDAKGGEVRDIQVGYDMNNDLLLDRDMNIYRSSNGLDFLVYSPDGQVQEWLSPSQKSTTDQAPTTGTAVLPPGSTKTTTGTEPPPKNSTITQPPTTPPVPKIPVPKPLPLPEPLPGL